MGSTDKEYYIRDTTVEYHMAVMVRETILKVLVRNPNITYWLLVRNTIYMMKY